LRHAAKKALEMPDVFLCAFFLPVIKNSILLSASSFATQNCLPFRGLHPFDTRNAALQHIARDSRLVVRHIRTQTCWSLNECVLVRLASQAVQPSQNIVAHRPWSGRYAPCFSPTSPLSIGLSSTAARLLEV
jgi:hypothetical protein